MIYMFDESFLHSFDGEYHSATWLLAVYMHFLQVKLVFNIKL